MCARDASVCVWLRGLTDEATGGPATRVCVCVVWGRGVFMCVYVSAPRVEPSLRDAGAFSLASTFSRGSGAQISDRIICHLFTSSQELEKWHEQVVSLSSSLVPQTDVSGCKHPPILLSSPEALFQ